MTERGRIKELTSLTSYLQLTLRIEIFTPASVSNNSTPYGSEYCGGSFRPDPSSKRFRTGHSMRVKKTVFRFPEGYHRFNESSKGIVLELVWTPGILKEVFIYCTFVSIILILF